MCRASRHTDTPQEESFNDLDGDIIHFQSNLEFRLVQFRGQKICPFSTKRADGVAQRHLVILANARPMHCVQKVVMARPLTLVVLAKLNNKH
jgi:hypothetical protein